MVDGINWNPFTNQVLSAEQIKKLDTSKDGKVSLQELESGLSWLSGQDEDGEIKLENDLYKNVNNAGKNMGVNTDKAATKDELEVAMEIVAQEFKKQYFSQNSGIDDSTKKIIEQLISAEKNRAVNEMVKNNKGPWNIKLATIEFQNDMEKLISDYNNNKAAAQNTLKGYTDQTDANYEALKKYTNYSNEDGVISSTELNMIRNKSAQYLLGTLLNGGSEADKFLSGIDKNYKSNPKYQAVLDIIDKLGQETDPQKLQELIQKATNSITDFLKSIDSKGDNLIASIKGEKSSINQQEELTQAVGQWLESNINSSMSESDKAKLKEFAQAAKDKFVKECYSTGKYVPMKGYESLDETNAFKKYLSDQHYALKNAQSKLKTDYTDKIESLNDNLVNVLKDVNANGNVSETPSVSGGKSEKDRLVAAATDLIFAQLLSNIDNVEILNNLGKSGSLSGVKSLISKIQSCSDPNEIKTLVEEAKGSIANILNSVSGDTLADAVNKTRPMTISDNAKNNAVYNSELSDAYMNNESRCSGRGSTSNQDLRAEIENKAKADMKTYAESLKAQLKKELGSAYDDSSIDAIIESAFNDTIAQFWSGYHDRGNQHGNYSTPEGTNSFTSARRSNTKKRRFSYNVRDLINTFTENFNKAAVEVKKQKNNPATITYDKEDVLVNSGIADEYGKNDVLVSSKDDPSGARTEALAKLRLVAAQIKANLVSRGSQIPSSVIDDIINESLVEITKDLASGNSSLITKHCYDEQNWLFDWHGDKYEYLIQTQSIINSFFDAVDSRIKEYQKKNK